MEERIITLVGRVEKLIDRSIVKELQQAQIAFTGADYLYDQLRVPNVHDWAAGKTVELTIRLV